MTTLAILSQAVMLAVVTPQGPSLAPLDTVAPAPVEHRIEAPAEQCPGLKKWRLINAAVNVADVASTTYIVESGKGTEANPIIKAAFGKRPKWYELSAVKAVGFGFNEFMAQRALRRGDCRDAIRSHKWGAFVTGGIVVWNMTVAVR